MVDSSPHSHQADQSERSFPWLKFYEANVPHEIDIPEKSLPWLLEEAARNHGKNDALIFYGTKITYAQLNVLADRFATSLLDMGIKPGDRISICLPNVPQFPIAFYGTLRAGAIAVPTNPLYTERELEHQLNDSGAVAMVTLDSLYRPLHNIRVKTNVQHVILASVPEYLPKPLAFAFALNQIRTGVHPTKDEKSALTTDKTIHRFQDMIHLPKNQQNYSLHNLPEPASPDDPAVLQYTGGTTGVAKGAILTHRNLLSNAYQTLVWMGDQGDHPGSTLCAAPFFHVYGLTVCLNLSVIGGATMILLPRFIPKDVIKTIQRYKPTVFPGVPTMYLAISKEVEKNHADITSIQICISGAAPLPAEVQSRFETLSGARLVEGYGLTEASPVTHANPLQENRKSGTIGVPLPSTEAAVADPVTGAHLPPGEVGELVIRGPQVMAGYWQRPDETAKVLRDGWLFTGDMATMDEDGYFTIVDRAKDIIIAGGFNIYPREVEEVLFQHPDISEAVVVGIPDEYRGETVKAYIVLKDGHQATSEDITAFCKERLAVFKIPKKFEFRTELPKTLIGKVLRRALREEEMKKIEATAAVAKKEE